MQESGWFDERVIPLVAAPCTWLWQQEKLISGFSIRWWAHWLAVNSSEKHRNRFWKRAAKPDRKWCRAVAAVLLFGEWSQKMWPLVCDSAFGLMWMTSSDIQVHSRDGFETGMTVEFPALERSGYATVTSIDRGAGTLTVSARNNTVPSGDYIHWRPVRSGLPGPRFLRVVDRRRR